MLIYGNKLASLENRIPNLFSESQFLYGDEPQIASFVFHISDEQTIYKYSWYHDEVGEIIDSFNWSVIKSLK